MSATPGWRASRWRSGLPKPLRRRPDSRRETRSYRRADRGETALPSPTIELHEAAAALQAMAAAASAGLPVTKAAVRDTVGLIREQVRVCRGLPVRQTRARIGQTIGPEP